MRTAPVRTQPVGSPSDEHRSGVVAGLTAYVLWGLLTVYWKLLHHFDAVELIGWRVASAAVVMVGVLSVQRHWSHLSAMIRDRRLLGRVALASVLLTANWTAYVTAIVHDHVMETALGYFIAPLLTMTLGVLVFGERLHTSQRIAVALAGVSIVVLTISYGHVPWLALIIAASWTCYGWMKKQVPLSPLESMSAETFVLVVPAVLVVLWLSGRDTSVVHSATGIQFVLIALTGVATVVPLTLFAHASTRVPLTLLGPMQYCVPSINFLLGWLAYDEALPISRVVGFAFVWVGLAIFTTDSVRRGRTSAATRARAEATT